MKKLIIRNKRTEALAIEHDEEKVHFFLEKRDEQTRTKDEANFNHKDFKRTHTP